MALDVGIVGPPGSGKTTLFTALTGVRPEGYGTPHVGIAPIADERLPQIADVVGSAKQTPATIRLIDVPGTAAAQLGGVRRADALLAVVRDTDDLPSLELELLVADRDHVERRLERVRKDAKSGDPTLRAEVELLERLIAHIDDERALARLARRASVRAGAADDQAADPDRERPGRRRPRAGGRAPRSPSRGGGTVPERRLVGIGGRRPPARVRPRSRGLLHGRRHRGPRLDAEEREDRPGCRRLDPHRHRARASSAAR